MLILIKVNYCTLFFYKNDVFPAQAEYSYFFCPSKAENILVIILKL